MKILIVSDTHGKALRLGELVPKLPKLDAMIHCGDVEGEDEYIAKLFSCPSFIVSGNNDYFSDLSSELEFIIGGKRFFITHGHRYGVSMGPEYLLEEAESRRADIAVFGHTHHPYLQTFPNHITLLNPGSLTYPRQRPRKPSYVLMDIDENGRMSFDFRYFSEREKNS